MSTSSIAVQLRTLLKELHLGSCDIYAVMKELGPGRPADEVLLAYLSQVKEQRRTARAQRLIREAGFPRVKTLDDLELDSFGGQITADLLSELASCRFVDEHRNLVVAGGTGRGKTHLAIGVGRCACELGHRVMFRHVLNLVTELDEAREQAAQARLWERLLHADLLIIDELGYTRLSRAQSDLLFKIISDRSERSSTLVTTNLSFSQWEQMFEEPAQLEAMIDRLTYSAILLDVHGPSFRLESSRRETRRAA